MILGVSAGLLALVEMADAGTVALGADRGFQGLPRLLRDMSWCRRSSAQDGVMSVIAILRQVSRGDTANSTAVIDLHSHPA